MSFWYPFDGAAIPAGTTNASTGTGTLSVSGGLLSLATGSSGVALLRRTAATDYSTAGMIRALHLPVNGGGGAIWAGGRHATSTQRLPCVGRTSSGNVFGGIYRDSDGFASALYSVAYQPWVRFRRSGTTIVYETSGDSTDGLNGTWTTIGTENDGGLWDVTALSVATDQVGGDGTSVTHTCSAYGDPNFASGGGSDFATFYRTQLLHTGII